MKLLCALLVASSFLFAQVIDGTVIDSVTRAPLGGVTVQVEKSGKTVYQADSDLRGAFRIEGVGDGNYTAQFSKRGFLQPDRDAAARRPFRVVTGSTPIHLEVQMTPLATISGRVLDGNDKPVPRAVVELFSAGGFGGEIRDTDEEGRFSFDQVFPSRRVLGARPPSGLQPPLSADGQPLGWVYTYYPGALDKTAAERILFRPGVVLPGYDIKLLAMPVHSLRGLIFDADGNSAAGVTVTLTPADEITPREFQTVSSKDGSFEFPALHDGEWRLSAETLDSGTRVRGSTSVFLTGADIDRQVLRLGPPFPIQGHVFFERSGTAEAAKPEVGVMLVPSVGGSGVGWSPVDQAGNFKTEGLYEGSYKVMPVSPGPPYYLASVTLGDRQVLGRYVELNAGSQSIRVNYKSDGGAVRGKVQDCRDATVVLLPQDMALRESEFLRRARCDESGKYEISSIRPGLYYAYALEEVGSAASLISRFDQSLINQGVTVQIRPTETVTVDLRVTTQIFP